jgi:hypothetical protein
VSSIGRHWLSGIAAIKALISSALGMSSPILSFFLPRPSASTRLMLSPTF